MPKGFDFTRAMRALCHDVTQRLDDFRHVRIDEMAVTFAQARRRVPHGLQAKLTPMRFEDGSLFTRRARPDLDARASLRRQSGDALHPDVLSAAVSRSLVPREADHRLSRAVPHQPAVRRRHPPHERPLPRPHAQPGRIRSGDGRARRRISPPLAAAGMRRLSASTISAASARDTEPCWESGSPSPKLIEIPSAKSA